MKMENDEIDPRLAELLDGLKSVPERDHRAALRGKNKFLAEAVALSESRRQNWWTTIFQPRQKLAANLLASVLVLTGLLVGSGATVVAAQEALPNETLYPVKLFSEDVQLFFNTDPATEVELLMQQAQARTQEMTALNEQGVTPPDLLMTRAQDRIEQALEIASTMDESEIPTTLLQIRDQLQTQDQLIGDAQDGHCEGCEPILRQTRDMLRTHLDDVEDGLADPQGFIHHRESDVLSPEPDEAPATVEPNEAATKPVSTQESMETPEPANCQQESCEPVSDGAGQQNMGTPMPQQQQGGGQSPESGGPPDPQKEPGGQQPPPGQPGEGGRP